MLLAFNTLMPRLDAVHASRSAAAPDGFEERINFWHRECGLPTELRSQLHSLRIYGRTRRSTTTQRGGGGTGRATRGRRRAELVRSCRGDGASEAIGALEVLV